MTPTLDPREERIAAALAAAAMPAGAFLEGGGPRTVLRLREWLVGSSPFQVRAIRALLWTAELSAIPMYFTPSPTAYVSELTGPREVAPATDVDWDIYNWELR